MKADREAVVAIGFAQVDDLEQVVVIALVVRCVLVRRGLFHLSVLSFTCVRVEWTTLLFLMINNKEPKLEFGQSQMCFNLLKSTFSNGPL